MLKSNVNVGGRPKAIYRPKLGGDPVVGLTRLGDGRWRASGPEKYTFTEPDEALTIARFREWELSKTGSNLGALKVHANAEDALIDICQRTEAAGGSLDATVERDPEGRGTWAVADDHLTPKQWRWLRGAATVPGGKSVIAEPGFAPT